ncbi:hypothetical protein CRG98_025724 [Punica granatum]|uniref:Uncharacterized protein n=1 Tax=Punica granatum TaxID=22663 RepID=A0A2I0JDC7_PUNGR|nr:hypothetical protein CRG98_025724 [Punica granatum]
MDLTKQHQNLIQQVKPALIPVPIQTLILLCLVFFCQSISCHLKHFEALLVCVEGLKDDNIGGRGGAVGGIHGGGVKADGVNASPVPRLSGESLDDFIQRLVVHE